MSGVNFNTRINALSFRAGQNTAAGKAVPVGVSSQQSSIKSEENPINEKGEKWILIPSFFAGCLLLPLRIIFSDAGEALKLTDLFFDCLKPKTLAAFAGLTCLGAALLTIISLPKISYEAKKKSFTKTKDLDVYIASNKISKELYDEFIERTKNASPAEKEKLWQQYLKLNAAKEKAPEFVKLNKDVSKAINREFSQKMPPMSVMINNSGSQSKSG